MDGSYGCYPNLRLWFVQSRSHCASIMATRAFRLKMSYRNFRNWGLRSGRRQRNAVYLCIWGSCTAAFEISWAEQNLQTARCGKSKERKKRRCLWTTGFSTGETHRFHCKGGASKVLHAISCLAFSKIAATSAPTMSRFSALKPRISGMP